MNDGWFIVMLWALCLAIATKVLLDLSFRGPFAQRVRAWWERHHRKLKQKPTMFYAFGSETDKQWIGVAMERGECPDCSNDKFYRGPEGGGCQNIQCTKCGQAWNNCGFIVFRNPWNQFQYSSTVCTSCSGSGEVSGDMHGQHYHCRFCYGHGYVLIANPPPAVIAPPIVDEGIAAALEVIRYQEPLKPKPPKPPEPPKLSRRARRKIRLRKEQP
jgi:hypothetical protein